MLKQEKINIQDTNLALFGSDLEKEIKKHSAEGEAAWKAINKQPGILVWRIEKFKVVPWPKEQYGKFYDGDSYIVLRTYKVEDAIKYDVHFWLGTYTSQDEYGTAAYKTVELDNYLDGTPVQYREVQNFESDKFLSLFPNFSVMQGGIESGFKHVEAVEFRKRLLHVKGTLKNVVVREVPAHTSSLNKGDVFILDLGLKVITLVGPKAGIAEKNKGTQLARALDDERGSKVKIEVISLEDKDDAATEFWNFLGGKADIAESAGDDANAAKISKKMFKVHEDAGGKISFTEVPFQKSSLDTTDSFVVDVINQIFVWCGKGCTTNEKKFGFNLAQNYLNQQGDRPKTLPIVRVMEGGENEEFLANF
jgi:gelsolin